MLRKLVLSFSLFGSILMFWGCPYSSKVQLGNPVEAIMPELLGSWSPAEEINSEFPSYYALTELDSVHYQIIHYQYNNDQQEYTPLEYVGHTTKIGELTFLNVDQSENDTFLLYRIEISRGEIVLYEVTDNIDEEFQSTEEMHKFFAKNMNSSFFYNKDEVKLIKKQKK